MTDEELLAAIRAIVREEVNPLIEWIENRRAKDRERQRKRYKTSREVFSRENSPNGSLPSSPSHTLPLTPNTPSPFKLIAENEGSKEPKTPSRKPKDWGEFWTFCQKKGYTHDEAVWYFSTWEANGWTTNNKPIQKWKAKVVSWHMAGYFDSHKNNGTIHPR